MLLVESTVISIISSYTRQRRDIQPAVTVIIDTYLDCKHFNEPKPLPDPDSELQVQSGAAANSPKILIQTFSNGGTNTAAQLLLVVRERLQAPSPLIGLLCDSGPAKMESWKSQRALVLSLPRDIFSRVLGAIVCHGIIIYLFVWIAMGNERPSSLQHRVLLDSRYVQEPLMGSNDKKPLSAQKGRRVNYLYSKADRMCFWADVSEHAEEASDQGWQVREALFEASGHCAHYQKYEKEYADMIKATWEEKQTTSSRVLVARALEI